MEACELVFEEALRPGEGMARCWVRRNLFHEERLEDWWEWVRACPQGWRQNDIVMFGQRFKEPRVTAWWGPAYTYAGIAWPEAPLPAKLETLRQAVEQEAGHAYNAVLANGYRHGQDSMGWHRDNEPEMDTTSIASVSLGATRTFKVRRREDKRVWNVDLAHGDLLVMERMQHAFEHALPKRKKVGQPRLNFTFRRLV